MDVGLASLPATARLPARKPGPAGPAISSFSHKPSRNLFQWARIVVCFVGFSILQVCYRELIAGRRVIAHSRKPERFQVEQVTGVFLSRLL
jgi:hypothetical protein